MLPPIRSRAALIAWSIWTICVALTLVALVFFVVNGDIRPADSTSPPIVDAVFAVAALAFPTVGAAIATRQPRNTIGWLFLVAGLGSAAGQSLLGYATYALLNRPGRLPGGAWAGLLTDVIWWPALAGGSLLLFLFFPNGTLLSRRWRWLVGLILVDLAGYMLATIANSGPLYYFPSVPNPVGFGPSEGMAQLAVDLSGPTVIAMLALGLLALGIRFRRSHGVERRQIQWLFYSAAIWVGGIPVMLALGEANIQIAGGIPIADLLFSVVIVMVPIAVGIAILRHRLYDIDVVINRTLVYGALTVTLGVAYLGSVLLLQLVLNPLTQGSGLAVAGSTLAVAALFRPMRTRIRAAVDRRFYRRKYDAARTLERFGLQLRNELDLESLAGDLCDVVRETMQPARVSLWLRRAD